MLDLEEIKGFEWDKGNVDKSYGKHGINPNEAEEVFLDEDVVLQKDINHSQKEKRFITIGKTKNNRILFTVFTMRDGKARIISARRANKKERRQYEDT